MTLQSAEHLLPESMLAIIDAIGITAAEQLVTELGGVTFAIGRGIIATERMRMLQAAIGEQSTAKLMEIFGNEDLYIPKCEVALRHLRNERFREDVIAHVEAGESKSMAILKLCKQYGISDRLAWSILANPPPKPSHQKNLL